jgi:hypothetical protein
LVAEQIQFVTLDLFVPTLDVFLFHDLKEARDDCLIAKQRRERICEGQDFLLIHLALLRAWAEPSAKPNAMLPAEEPTNDVTVLHNPDSAERCLKLYGVFSDEGGMRLAKGLLIAGEFLNNFRRLLKLLNIRIFCLIGFHDVSPYLTNV